MPNFLFWNVAGRQVEDLISALADSHQIDLLILAECKIKPSTLTEALNKSKPNYQLAMGYCEALMFFTRFHRRFLMPVFESPRISIRRLRLPARKEILIAAAHLPSKMYFTEDSLVLECVELARRIEEQECSAGQ